MMRLYCGIKINQLNLPLRTIPTLLMAHLTNMTLFLSTTDDGEVTFHYYTRDYLGNNRAVINGTTGEIEQTVAYYPSGGVIADLGSESGVQPYKFGDKELITANGLNEYDFGARRYWPSLPMFTSIDPESEKLYWLSPYLYCANNPVNAIDNDGRKVILVNGHWSSAFSRIKRVTGIPVGPGEKYWQKGFAEASTEHFNTDKFLYVDGSSEWGGDQSGGDRFSRGIEYVRQNLKDIVGDLNEGEPIDIVTHSEGAAMGAGIAYQLLKDGIEVRNVYHLSADEGDEFSTPSKPFTLQYSYYGDWITGNHLIQGTDALFIDYEYQNNIIGQIFQSHGSTNYVGIFKIIENILNKIDKHNLMNGKEFKVNYNHEK